MVKEHGMDCAEMGRFHRMTERGGQEEEGEEQQEEEEGII